MIRLLLTLLALMTGLGAGMPSAACASPEAEIGVVQPSFAFASHKGGAVVRPAQPIPAQAFLPHRETDARPLSMAFVPAKAGVIIGIDRARE